MADSTTDPLAQASGLLLAKRPAEARAVLAAYLKTNPTSDQAWYLMSHAVSDPDQQLDCLERALHLNPNNLAARERLGLLTLTPPPALGPASPAPYRAPEPPASIYRDAELPAPARRPPEPPAPYRAPEPPASSYRDADPPPVYSSTLAWPPPAHADEDAAPPPTPDSLGHLRGQFITPGAALEPEPVIVKPPRARDWPMVFLGGVAVLFVLGLLATAAVFVLRPKPTPIAVVVIPNTPVSFPTLPPTWTATVKPLVTPTPSPIPTRTPRATATFEVPQSTQAAQMDKIAEQVADLRGLAIQGAPDRYLIARDRVAETLEGLVLDPDRRAALENELRVLSVLGLVKPTYDLVKYALNSSADGLGGFYIPWTKQMFVIGDEFSGMERFIYSHEYDHALTDQHFNIAAMGVYPSCQLDAQRCTAIRALVEGDAEILMYQWLYQYATPQDYKDLSNYDVPDFALPEEFPPPYISQDINFPYTYGADFVQYLYDRGRWAAVNKAYERLPDSTEQIMHPEKYLAQEAPITVTDALLAEALPPEWVALEDDVLGEWMSYLILGYGADYEAILDDDTASTAAGGWGGDHYQVYYQPTLDQTVLAAHWTWDTPRDNTQFADALRTYLDARLRGAKVPRTDGDCWEANNQAGCVFVADGETLWLYAPNQTLINDLLALFPQFQ